MTVVWEKAGNIQGPQGEPGPPGAGGTVTPTGSAKFAAEIECQADWWTYPAYTTTANMLGGVTYNATANSLVPPGAGIYLIVAVFRVKDVDQGTAPYVLMKNQSGFQVVAGHTLNGNRQTLEFMTVTDFQTEQGGIRIMLRPEGGTLKLVEGMLNITKIA